MSFWPEIMIFEGNSGFLVKVDSWSKIKTARKLNFYHKFGSKFRIWSENWDFQETKILTNFGIFGREMRLFPKIFGQNRRFERIISVKIWNFDQKFEFWSITGILKGIIENLRFLVNQWNFEKLGFFIANVPFGSNCGVSLENSGFRLKFLI